jgi:carbonic anhydrase
MNTRLLSLACALHLLTSCNALQRGTSKSAAAEPAPHTPTASQVIAKLKQGNRRFAHHHQKNPDQNSKRVHQLVTGQHPIATVLCCSDSRVPPEIVFDQGLGDVFVVREAGHVADDATLGSIEYAVEHLKTPVIIVMGHESCGAVTAAVDAKDTHKSAGGHIQRLVEDISPAVDAAGATGSRESQIARAVTANVKLVIKQLSADPSLAKSIREGEVKIVGAVYDLHSGRVIWL